MDNKKRKFFLIGILIGLVITIIAVGGLFLIKKINFNNSSDTAIKDVYIGYFSNENIQYSTNLILFNNDKFKICMRYECLNGKYVINENQLTLTTDSTDEYPISMIYSYTFNSNKAELSSSNKNEYCDLKKVLIENNQVNTTDSNVDKENNNSIDYKDYEEKLEDGTTIKYTFAKNSNYVSKIGIEDTYAFSAMPETGINTFILKEGKVYYYSETCQDKEHCIYYRKPLDKIEWKEYSATSNIKRIKSGNFFSNGVDFSIILITEDGKLISGRHNYETGDFTFENFEQSNVLTKYKIDNILEWGVPGGPGSPTWKVVLQDGTILTKTVK